MWGDGAFGLALPEKVWEGTRPFDTKSPEAAKEWDTSGSQTCRRRRSGGRSWAISRRREPAVADLADAVASASEKSLANATKNPVFIEALWLLLKVPEFARSDHFANALRELGLKVPDDPSLTEVVVAVDGAIEAAKRRHATDTDDLSEMAKHAAVAALDSLARERLPQLSGADAPG